jgi:hypothetical protein
MRKHVRGPVEHQMGSKEPLSPELQAVAFGDAKAAMAEAKRNGDWDKWEHDQKRWELKGRHIFNGDWRDIIYRYFQRENPPC